MGNIRKVVFAIAAFAISSCAQAGWFGGMDAGRALGRNVGESVQGSENGTNTLYLGGSRAQFAQAHLGETKDGAAQVTPRAVISPNGPGAWMKDAPWNEVVFTVRNLTGHDIEITSVRGVTAQGVFADQGGIDQLKALEEQRRLALQKQADNSNQPKLLGAFIPSLASTAVGMIPGATLGGGMPLAGARTTFMGGVAEGKATSHSRAREEQGADFQKIANEYRNRSVERVKLAPHGAITGSAFFPVSGDAVIELAISLREDTRDFRETELTVKLPSTPAPLTASASAPKAGEDHRAP